MPDLVRGDLGEAAGVPERAGGEAVGEGDLAEGDAPEARANITINLPDSQTPEAYLRAIRVAGEGGSCPTPLPVGGEGLPG